MQIPFLGVSIGYSGSLNDPSLLDELIAYTRQRVKVWRWECCEYRRLISGMLFRHVNGPWIEPSGSPEQALLPTLIEDELRGVVLLPPWTDAVCLTFNQAGRLVSYCELPPHPTVAFSLPGEEKCFLEVSLSTTLTGAIEVHLRVARLLRELQANFIRNLEVRDNTGFWETGDLRALATEHLIFGAWMEVLRASGEGFSTGEALLRAAPTGQLTDDAFFEPASALELAQPRRKPRRTVN
ncbi:MAG: hypothetical protein NZV14_03650 [Bryobacteraceae bacterium]|nr:hypothetical protein [Bryobacteraceae bacterium]MDW8377231.1 hypothetical protein [Bryobacterales bacterium]